jgi:hypothetical protein
MRSEPAVDQAELVLVVADPELHVGEVAFDLAREVRLGAQDLGVPVTGGCDVVGEEVHGRQPAQHR